MEEECVFGGEVGIVRLGGRLVGGDEEMGFDMGGGDVVVKVVGYEFEEGGDYVVVVVGGYFVIGKSFEVLGFFGGVGIVFLFFGVIFCVIGSF